MTFSTLASPGVSLQGGGDSGGGGGGTPGGSNTQIQYNSSGTFAGASGLTTTGTELTIASGTKTADAPVLNMSQTWNASGVTFTGLKFNATDTASAAASLLMDLQVGGTSQFKISKTGQVQLAAGSVSVPSLSFEASSGFYRPSASSLALTISGGAQWVQFGNLFRAASSMAFGWASGEPIGNNIDTILTRRGAANLRLGAADAATPVAQTLSVQSVVAGTSNTAGANLTITGSQGTGTGAGGSIIFQVAPAGSSGTAQNALVTAWSISGAGHLLAGADNTYDIGASGANRPRNIYAAGSYSGSGYVNGASGYFYWNTRSTLSSPADGQILIANLAVTDFNRLQFGGTTSSFPAIKRSSTTLQARLADDSAFAGFASANMQAATAYTVATLPGTPGTGMIARVTDALAPTIGATVTGGGAAYALVNYNGANWTVIGV